MAREFGVTRQTIYNSRGVMDVDVVIAALDTRFGPASIRSDPTSELVAGSKAVAV